MRMTMRTDMIIPMSMVMSIVRIIRMIMAIPMIMITRMLMIMTIPIMIMTIITGAITMASIRTRMRMTTPSSTSAPAPRACTSPA
jgi:hypothetical protein